MQKLSFEDVVDHWQKINTIVDGQAFVDALWTYCRSQAVYRWQNIFGGRMEVRRFTNIFYDENGFVYVNVRGRERVRRYNNLTPILAKYFVNFCSQECGFIASLMMKFFAVLYPNRRDVTIDDILGKKASRASNNFVSSSKWCREIERKTFDGDYRGDDEQHDSIMQVD
ncbi:unnamed protein product [Orchesella dallaii]|uniref:Uncharacterized protein n=1 Tax=Orchesella dallaii TaxID=48710 RepID=A0ABP1PW02_9HEXA